jgi:hypothetical protein
VNPFCRCLLIGLALGSVVLPCSTACADEAPTRIFVVDDSKPPASTRWKLVGGGLLASASFYGAALPFALQWPDAPGVKDLRAPVVGPWLALAHNGCAADDTDCSTAWRVVRGLFEILDGLGQAGGLGIALEGMFLPTGPESTTQRPGAPRTVPSPNGEPAPSNEPRNLFYLPRPIVVGKQGVGFGVAGVF